MARRPQTEIVSDNPRPSRPRRLQGSHFDAPRTISDRIFQPAPVTLPLRGSLPSLDPALQHSLGFPPFRLAASLRASLAPTFRCLLEVRRALVSELRTGCASGHARSMAIWEIQTFSPPFFVSSPGDASAIPSFSQERPRVPAPSSAWAGSPRPRRHGADQRDRLTGPSVVPPVSSTRAAPRLRCRRGTGPVASLLVTI
jgi:hypothetical protein